MGFGPWRGGVWLGLEVTLVGVSVGGRQCGGRL
jgi:hypothetical protein